jgi:hypothetical protein
MHHQCQIGATVALRQFDLWRFERFASTFGSESAFDRPSEPPGDLFLVSPYDFLDESIRRAQLLNLPFLPGRNAGWDSPDVL